MLRYARGSYPRISVSSSETAGNHMGAGAHDPRTQEQATYEKAMSEVSDVLTNIGHALERAKRAKKRLGTSAEEHNVQLALTDAITGLEKIHKDLQRDAYFAGQELRLL